jgi:hypothetical protein
MVTLLLSIVPGAILRMGDPEARGKVGGLVALLMAVMRAGGTCARLNVPIRKLLHSQAQSLSWAGRPIRSIGNRRSNERSGWAVFWLRKWDRQVQGTVVKLLRTPCSRLSQTSFLSRRLQENFGTARSGGILFSQFG